MNEQDRIDVWFHIVSQVCDRSWNHIWESIEAQVSDQIGDDVWDTTRTIIEIAVRELSDEVGEKVKSDLRLT